MPLKHRLKIILLILLWLVIVVKTPAAIYLPLTLFGIYVLYIVWPRFDLTPSVSLKDKERTIALTFDDGPTPGFTDKILDILKTTSATATFFMLGQKIEKNSELAKKVLLSGNEIGGHTYAHKKLHFLNYEEIDNEISKTQELIKAIYAATGNKENFKNIFRAPHGFKSFTLKKYLRDKGIALIPWTKGVWDTALPGEHHIYKEATRSPSNVEILLLHDGHEPADDVLAALPKIIDFYKNNGYKFVKVSELIKGEHNVGGYPK
ncbi:MAG: polysaccharide deacetylase family protein [Pseudomonadota bacterium]